VGLGRRLDFVIFSNLNDPVFPAEEMDVDVESTDDLPADLDWSSSPSDLDERGSLQSVCSDEGYASAGVKRLELQSDRKPPLGL